MSECFVLVGAFL